DIAVDERDILAWADTALEDTLQSTQREIEKTMARIEADYIRLNELVRLRDATQPDLRIGEEDYRQARLETFTRRMSGSGEYRISLLLLRIPRRQIINRHSGSHKEETVTASQTILKTFDWPSLGP
ncbi:hypothetical protein M5D96_012681, partial [Drosophila gunungcola]